MFRKLLLCVVLFGLQLPGLGAEWLLLKDGRVGRGDPGTDPMEVTLRGGRKEKVPREQLAASRSDRAVTTVCGHPCVSLPLVHDSA